MKATQRTVTKIVRIRLYLFMKSGERDVAELDPLTKECDRRAAGHRRCSEAGSYATLQNYYTNVKKAVSIRNFGKTGQFLQSDCLDRIDLIDRQTSRVPPGW